jgi:hypothetical protein
MLGALSDFLLFIMDNPITLNCLVLDFDSQPNADEVFPITISRNKTIYALKGAVKDVYKREMDQVPTPRLSIWTADIPIRNSDLNSSVGNILKSVQKAMVIDKLSVLFPKVNPHNIHILVKQSGACERVMMLPHAAGESMHQLIKRSLKMYCLKFIQ